MRISLTAIPFIWIILCLPWANRVEPTLDGIPFLAVWIQLGVLITSFCLGALYHYDKKHRKDED